MNKEAVLCKAPGKIILFGEHAINRGQSAIAAAVGLYATCAAAEAPEYLFISGSNRQQATHEQIAALCQKIELFRREKNYEGIRSLARSDYFAPQKYVLGSVFGDRLPTGLSLTWNSQIPCASGLGSGGAAFTAMVGCLENLLGSKPSLQQRAQWAQCGDIVAHGGIASGLDTQTSLLGGVVRFTGEGLAQSIECADGLEIVIANSGITAATSEVNTRVRLWLAENPKARIKYFETIGTLAEMAISPLKSGNWNELGRLMTLNQLALAKIGVSTPKLDQLIESALQAGAHGAKISGSGGGGIIIALVSQESRHKVVEALEHAGATVLQPQIGVSGAKQNKPVALETAAT